MKPIATLNYSSRGTTVEVKFFSRRSIWQLCWGVFTLWRNTFIPQSVWDVLSGLWTIVLVAFTVHAYWRLDATDSPHDFHQCVIWSVLLVLHTKGRRIEQ